MAKSKERHFEDEVFDSLVTDGGWIAGLAADIESETGTAPAELLTFIGQTQIETWNELLVQMGNDPDRAQREFRKRVAAEIDKRGTVDVLRHGVRGWGLKFDLCYFKPVHGLTPLLVERYQANRLTVTRQQRYSTKHRNTVDLCLWVNGLAVATVELKNELTNQTVEDAKAQYRTNRDPADRFLSKRAVVHFAVDPYLVFMTTRLAGASTQFLPFNKGHNGHAGNPPATDGKHATAYLWDQVWQRDAFLDLLGRFIHTEIDESGKATGKVTFPRYHQWDCVLRMEADARANGPGRRYLAQHSAGSGKSNSIAWLAHRLSKLHDDHDKAVFDKVVVITDRRVLDDQLSATVAQFESVAGVVVRVEDKEGAKSTKLAEALAGEQARIIVCTLQTFSFVLDKIAGVGRRNYAVIVDEAHSSQTGEAARDLKAALGAGSEEARLEIVEKKEAGEPVTAEDKLNEAIAARAHQENLSFFAFTATPKPRTVELFGTPVPGADQKAPFHTYSMRQAIEEGFILDVLRHYTPFGVYWRVKQSRPGDPEVDKSKASAQIAKAISLHPHNLAQRAKIVVDHFRQHVAQQIGGQAKAMVVTASRLHAVRYKQAIDRYLADAHITDVKALVAFSGKVIEPDDPNVTYTESGMNGIPEPQTAARFKGEPSPPYDPSEFQVLIVAEKFQTGFDAPLLHTMYVDKKLEGVNAVQTLARLNRTHPGKTDAFILDFRNDPETIAEGFRPFYDTTIVEPVDGNVLYSYAGAIESTGVFTVADVDNYWSVFCLVTPDQRKGNGALYAALAGAVERFKAELDEDAQERFRSDLDAYIRAYSFLSQIVTWTDNDLEKLYVWAKSLQSNLPKRPNDGSLDLGAEVELTHLRIEKAAEVDASLAGTQVEEEALSALPGAGGSAPDPQTERLSAIIERLNERHALNLTITDALLFEQFKGDWLADPELAAQAKANTLDNFLIVFAKKFLSTVLSRMDANADIFKAINDDKGFADDLKASYGREVYLAFRDVD
ncbi:MAG: type I restriction endonuclease [Actinomycetota bacterium]|nr:type I restriction endonuclease [Actinomycetota bacterium]